MHLKICFAGLRDGSAVKNISGSAGGPKFDAQHPYGVTYNHMLLQCRGTHNPLPVSKSTPTHMTYIHTDTHIHTHFLIVFRRTGSVGRMFP